MVACREQISFVEPRSAFVLRIFHRSCKNAAAWLMSPGPGCSSRSRAGPVLSPTEVSPPGRNLRCGQRVLEPSTNFGLFSDPNTAGVTQREANRSQSLCFLDACQTLGVLVPSFIIPEGRPAVGQPACHLVSKWKWFRPTLAIISSRLDIVDHWFMMGANSMVTGACGDLVFDTPRMHLMRILCATARRL